MCSDTMSADVPESDNWIKIFSDAMGTSNFCDLRLKVANSRDADECCQTLDDYTELLRRVPMPERVPCEAVQVNKDITRDKLVVNGREFAKHTGGTASQGLIRYLRRDLKRLVVDYMKLKEEPESSLYANNLVDWILQACTRTSHGADSFFAVSTLFAPAEKSDHAPSDMPRWLITPAKGPYRQDSEVFCGTRNDGKPFVLVCNHNDYFVQLRENAMITSRRNSGTGVNAKKNRVHVRTLIAELLSCGDGTNSSETFTSKRTLCIVTKRKARENCLLRLIERGRRRQIELTERCRIEDVLEHWLWGHETNQYDSDAVERLRRGSGQRITHQKQRIADIQFETERFHEEADGLSSSVSRLKTTVSTMMRDLSEIKRRASLLESAFDDVIKKQRKMSGAISKLKRPRRQSSTRRREVRRRDVVSPRSSTIVDMIRQSNDTRAKHRRVSIPASSMDSTKSSDHRDVDCNVVIGVRRSEMLWSSFLTRTFNAYVRNGSDGLNERGWLRCVRSQGIIPHLITVEVAKIMFEKHVDRPEKTRIISSPAPQHHGRVPRSSALMVRAQFVAAMTEIARVVFRASEKGSVGMLRRHAEAYVVMRSVKV